MDKSSIIAHRGWWLTKDEQNTVTAFKRAFEAGFGIETDLRYCNFTSKVVISHDIVEDNDGPMTLDSVFHLYNEYNISSWLALNIKEDGLINKLNSINARPRIDNYFYFDTSLPEQINYFKKGLRVFGRSSEYEDFEYTKSISRGVWIDSFEGEFPDEESLGLLSATNYLVFVSPELHKLSHSNYWKLLKDFIETQPSAHVMLCTDFPQTAFSYFTKHDN